MTAQPLCCYDYVNQPYPLVRDAVRSSSAAMFRHATAATAADTATLHVHFGGLDFTTTVAVQVTGSEDDHAYDRPATKLTIEWQAQDHPRLFPLMKATLVIFPLSATETQLELRGAYQPPMGKLGETIDAAVGHRLAVASVTRLLQEVAGWLRHALAAPAPAAPIGAGPTPPDARVDSEC
jgi:hypothetical protein